MKLYTKNSNRGLGATKGVLSFAYVLNKAIELNFLPKTFVGLEQAYHTSLWQKAVDNAKDFVYPVLEDNYVAKNLPYYGNIKCSCDDCITSFCNVYRETIKMTTHMSSLGANLFNVIGAFYLTLLYIAINELEGEEQQEAIKLLGDIINYVPKELQNKILGITNTISDANIKYMQPTSIETSDTRSEGYAKTISDANIKYATGSQSQLPSTTSNNSNTENYYIMGESRTPQTETNNTWLYVGGGVLLLVAVLGTVKLLTPDKKKKKK